MTFPPHYKHMKPPASSSSPAADSCMSLSELTTVARTHSMVTLDGTRDRELLESVLERWSWLVENETTVWHSAAFHMLLDN